MYSLHMLAVGGQEDQGPDWPDSFLATIVDLCRNLKSLDYYENDTRDEHEELNRVRLILCHRPKRQRLHRVRCVQRGEVRQDHYCIMYLRRHQLDHDEVRNVHD